MRSKTFILSGLLFGIISVCLSFLPRTTKVITDEYTPSVIGDIHQYKKTNTTTLFYNAGYGAIAIGIISATCFTVAGNLIKSHKEV